MLPMFVHQSAKICGPTFDQELAAAQSELLDVVQVGEHCRVVRLSPRVLVLQNRAGAARKASKEHQQIVFEVKFRVDADGQRLDLNAAIGVEREAGNPAAGGDVLVL